MSPSSLNSIASTLSRNLWPNQSAAGPRERERVREAGRQRGRRTLPPSLGKECFMQIKGSYEYVLPSVAATVGLED